MSVINMVKNIKEIHSKTLLIFKVGFSKKAIPRVLSKLEEQKIDYLLTAISTTTMSTTTLMRFAP